MVGEARHSRRACSRTDCWRACGSIPWRSRATSHAASRASSTADSSGMSVSSRSNSMAAIGISSLRLQGKRVIESCWHKPRSESWDKSAERGEIIDEEVRGSGVDDSSNDVNCVVFSQVDDRKPDQEWIGKKPPDKLPVVATQCQQDQGGISRMERRYGRYLVWIQMGVVVRDV